MHVNENNIDDIANPAFRAYARRYVEIQVDLLRQIQAMGVDIAENETESILERFSAQADGQGIRARNDYRSLCRGQISPACETCRKGEGTTTFYLSVACNRDCFFCFNPNQQYYNDHRDKCHDLIADLNARKANGIELHDIALTGGEPLLFREESISFFKHAHKLYPNAYTRLYTNGDFADEECLVALRDAGLGEIRLSVKQGYPEAGYLEDPVLDVISLAKRYIPRVMVEMPVMPRDYDNMWQLLIELDRRGCDGINLLELCFPFHNWVEYARRGYAVKNPPYRIAYNYEYAGGLPIGGSEEICVRLLEFAAQTDLRMGVHYCSLENKFSSQTYLQNNPYQGRFDIYEFSTRDFYFKSAKAFGGDAQNVREVLSVEGVQPDRFRESAGFLEFAPGLVPLIAAQYPEMEIALCYHVVDEVAGGIAMKELALDCVQAGSFEACDV